MLTKLCRCENNSKQIESLRMQTIALSKINFFINKWLQFRRIRINLQNYFTKIFTYTKLNLL